MSDLIVARNMRNGRCMADVMGVFQRARQQGRAYSQFRVADSAAQSTVVMTKSGKMRRVLHVANVVDNGLVSITPSNRSIR